MIIDYFIYFDSLDFNPAIVAFFISRNWFLVRFKNKSVWLVKVACPLTCTVGMQWVKVPWKVYCLFEIFCKTE